MPLRSQLFCSDHALQRCLVDDQAHLVKGSMGAHVVKVQRALVILDGALIDTEEVSTGRYGTATAAAVLDYKRKRRIINYKYQSQPDDAVGKMTIAALDEGMVAKERRVFLPGCNGDRGPIASGVAARRANVVADAPAPIINTPRATLRIVYQTAKTAPLVHQTVLQRYLNVRRANELLKPFGMRVEAQDGGIFPFGFSINIKASGDLEGLRQASERALPGMAGVARVIFCPFEAGFTASAVSAGRVTGVEGGFANFAVMNIRPEAGNPDFGTVLHELIHVSSDALMSDSAHDIVSSSVFAWGNQRTVLPPSYAESLRRSYFAVRE